MKKNKKNIYVSDAYLSVFSIIYLICMDYITVKYLNSSPKYFIIFYIIFFGHKIYFKDYYKTYISLSLTLYFVSMLILITIGFKIHFFEIISNERSRWLFNISYFFMSVSVTSIIDDLYNIYKDKNWESMEK